MTADERAAHAIAELDAQRALARRTARSQVDLLRDARAALRDGRLAVADEFIDRAVESLETLVQSLGSPNA